MKIMQMISSSGFYGAEKVVLGLAQGLREAGCDVVVASLCRPGRSDETLLERAGAMRIAAEKFLCRRRLDLRTVRELRRWTGENAVDIIHSHGYKSNFYALLSRSPAMTTGLVATCHNWPGKNIKMLSYRWLDKTLIKRFDRIAVVSELLRRETREAGISDEKLRVIHNGISLQGKPAAGACKTVRKELSLDSDAQLITAVGRLAPEKGYGYLIEAAVAVLAVFPQARFAIAGEGPQRNALAAAIASRGLGERVLLLGKRNDVETLLAASTVFVMPSLDEGMPVALLEAMAAAVPIVATSRGEIPRMLVAGIEGILVPPADATALANALLKLLRNPRIAERMGNSARRRVMKDFSQERMIRSYLDLYTALLDEKRMDGVA